MCHVRKKRPSLHCAYCSGLTREIYVHLATDAVCESREEGSGLTGVGVQVRFSTWSYLIRTNSRSRLARYFLYNTIAENVSFFFNFFFMANRNRMRSAERASDSYTLNARKYRPTCSTYVRAHRAHCRFTASEIAILRACKYITSNIYISARVICLEEGSLNIVNQFIISVSYRCETTV